MIGPRHLSTLLSDAGIAPAAPLASDPVVTGVSVDSRAVLRGEIFFALRGAKDDGARFAPDALARGASAVVAESPAPPGVRGDLWVRVADARRAMGLAARAWWDRPDETLTLVGITGTKGKTTVTYLVEAIARAAGREAGRIGTVGYAFGGRECDAPRTTPEATELFALLARMRDAGTEIVAMEVSSHAVALHRIADARFAVAAFLNLGRDHLDFHGTMEAYFEAKAALFARLSPHDAAVLPASDPRGDDIAARTRARVIRFGRGDEADVRVFEEAGGLAGSTARLETPGGTIEIRTSLPGRFNVLNAAAAAACALALGIGPEAIAAGIDAVSRVPGRLEPVQCGQPFAVLVDYAHTEESLAAVLVAVRELTRGRLTVVFGCGGNRDRGKRFGMGRAAALGADRIVLTSDNPRDEDPESILEEVAAGVAAAPDGSERCRIELDRARAISIAVSGARPGDAVVVAGKGHETTQTLRDRVVPFDDRQAVRSALSALGFRGGSRAGA
jgi:UDP-N-acetylmuramoyl-L-alanyl-D-glutamate--2,6-diaminopimelate ligase